MKEHLKKPWGVIVASVLTTLCCLGFTHTLAWFLYAGGDLPAVLRLNMVNTLLAALPVSYFIWAQVRKNVILSDELQQLLNRDRLPNAMS